MVGVCNECVVGDSVPSGDLAVREMGGIRARFSPAHRIYGPGELGLFLRNSTDPVDEEELLKM